LERVENGDNTVKNSVPIKQTAERWFHIIENHDDLAGYYDDVTNAIEEPDYIINKRLVFLSSSTY